MEFVFGFLFFIWIFSSAAGINVGLGGVLLLAVCVIAIALFG